MLALVIAVPLAGPAVGPHGAVYVPPPAPPPVYSGPGDTGRGAPPRSPGPMPGPLLPGKPTAPPSAPPGGGPGGPGVPGGALTGVGAGPDTTSWEHWWNYNGAGWLALRAAVHDVGVMTGSDLWFLGHGERHEKAHLAPTAEQIDQLVVPALTAALLGESSDDILTGALVALGKIGRRSGKPEAWRGRMTAFLKHPSQEVSETAAIALGISADPEAIPVLRELLLDTAEGRKLVGTSEVPYRTRAFAAYGLGIAGDAARDDDVRRRVLATLVEVLEAPGFATDDIEVAAVTAFGLVRAPDTDDEYRGRPQDRGPVRTHAEQVAFLLQLFDPGRRDGPRWTVRAHVATALGRLVVGAPEEVRLPVTAALLAALRERSGELPAVQEAAVLALGRVGDGDPYGSDGIVRSELARLVADGDPQVRSFALISLAQVGARPGSSGEPTAGREECQELLLKTLQRGRKTLRPWAALALGVHAAELRALEEPLPPALVGALSYEARRCRRPQDIGAYALALGLTGDADAEKVLLRKLGQFSQDSARGHVILGLGLLTEGSSIEAVREVLESATYRPKLLWDAAMGLALLGDKQVVPRLTTRLREARSQASQGAIAAALGVCGDTRAVEPLVAMLKDRSLTEGARAFAAVALGSVCDKGALPWNFRISEGFNYLAATPTLVGGTTGILNIL